MAAAPFNLPGLNPVQSTGAILGGAGALAGAFPTVSSGSGSGSGQTTSSGNTSTSGTTNVNQLIQFLQNLQTHTGTQGTSTSIPLLSPETSAFLANLMGRYSSLTSPSLTGYQAQQTQNINASSDAQQKAVDAIMASRGLSTSPVAATSAANIQQNRLNQINQVKENLPILQNQLDLANLGAATSLFSVIPKGTYGITSGTSDTSQTGGTTQQQSGTTNTAGTTSTNQTQQQQYNQQSNQQQGGGVGGALSGGLAAVLSFLLGL